MVNYSSVKNGLLESSVTARIHGVLLEGEHTRKGWFPISPCICVKEPCPCDRLDDIVVWLPTGTKGEKTGNKIEGTDVLDYAVTGDTQVIVETNIPMTAAGFKKVQHRVAESSCNPKSGLKIMAIGAPLPPGTGAGFFLGVAAAVGWGVGTFIDSETGASDKISDILAEHIPWPW